MARLLKWATCAIFVYLISPPLGHAMDEQSVEPVARDSASGQMPEQSGTQSQHRFSLAISKNSAPIRNSHPIGGMLYRPPGIEIGKTKSGERYVVLETQQVHLAFWKYEWVNIVHEDEWKDPRGLTGWTYWGKPGEAESPNFEVVGSNPSPLTSRQGNLNAQREQ